MTSPSPEPIASRRWRPAARSLHRERLSQAERIRLGFEILVAFVQARRELRRVPIADVVAALRSQSPQAYATESTLEEAWRLGNAVARTLSFVPGDTRCLARSLVLTQMLARRGIPARLVIGARTEPEFLAHAWVEYEGNPVLDPGGETFGRLVEL